MSKVLFVNHSIDVISGAEMSLLANILCLPKEFEPIVITPYGKVADFLNQSTNAKIVRLPLKPITKYYFINILINRKIIKEAILDISPDIVHANSTKARIITPSSACKKLVWQIRDMQKIPSIIKNKLYQGSNKIAIISQAVERFYGLEFSKRIFYLPPAIEIELIAEDKYKNKDNNKIIGFIGQYAPFKNHQAFINTIKILPKEYTGIMTGQKIPEIKDYHDEMVIKAAVTERIVTIPFTFNVVNDIYSKIFCLIVPSLDEPFGRIIIEAFMLGIPVITLSGGGINELVFDKKTGLLVQENNPKLFKEAIEFLENNPFLRSEMIKNAREFAENNFTFEKQRERLSELYHNI